MYERPPRSDAGHLLAIPRDHVVLTWIAEHYTVTFKQVQCLLVLYGKPPLTGSPLLSDTATRNALTRWQTLGFIDEPQRLWYQYPSFVWLSRSGLIDLGIPYRSYVLKRNQVHHFVAVNEVRLSLQGAGTPHVWTPRRTLLTNHTREDKGQSSGTDTPTERTFFPDSVLSLAGLAEPIAIAVIECAKPRQDLLLCTQGLLKQYRALRYYVCPEMIPVVAEIRATLPQGQLFDIYNLTTLQPVNRVPLLGHTTANRVLLPAAVCAPDAAVPLPVASCAPHSANPASQGKSKIKALQKFRRSSEQEN